MKAWQHAALAAAEVEAAALEDAGHTIIRLSDYHWRIDDKIDVWPSRKKFMLKGGTVVMHYHQLQDVIPKSHAALD